LLAKYVSNTTPTQYELTVDTIVGRQSTNPFHDSIFR